MKKPIKEIQSEFENYIEQFPEFKRFWNSMNETQQFLLVLNFNGFYAQKPIENSEVSLCDCGEGEL